MTGKDAAVESTRDADGANTDRLLERMYDELRTVAAALLRRHGDGGTLQPTALVHELYLRLARHEGSWQDTAHFRALAAVAMRRIVIDEARHHGALRRGGAWQRVTLADAPAPSVTTVVDLTLLRSALMELGTLNARHAELVQLRYLGGLSLAEIARVRGCSRETIKRDWRMARAWLFKRIAENG